MSADEIRKLANELRPEDGRYSCDMKTLSPVHTALLAYAAMVERCETEIAKLPYPPNGNDVCWFNKLNYILKGVANERKG